jgi:hypothetical protein
MDDFDMHEEIDAVTAEGYMLQDRRLPEKDRKRLVRADWHGEDVYYLPEHLEWVCVPTDEDPGVSTPKPGALPYFKDGLPVCEPLDPFFARYPKTSGQTP